MQYSQEIYRRWRRQAITSADEIQVGEEYWSNSYPSHFRVLRKLTEHAHNIMIQMERYLETGNWNEDLLEFLDNSRPAWLLVELLQENERPSNQKTTVVSLRDRNVGASYNPWMIFPSQELAKACSQELQVTFEADRLKRGEYQLNLTGTRFPLTNN